MEHVFGTRFWTPFFNFLTLFETSVNFLQQSLAPSCRLHLAFSEKWPTAPLVIQLPETMVTWKLGGRNECQIGYQNGG